MLFSLSFPNMMHYFRRDSQVWGHFKRIMLGFIFYLNQNDQNLAEA